MLSREFETIFVHVPKTGGQSIERVFLDKLKLTWEQRASLLLRANDDPARGPRRLAHLYAREYVPLRYVTQRDFARYFKFSVVRNPWARAVSAFKYKHQSAGVQFADFVSGLVNGRIFGRHSDSQQLYLFDENGSLLVDRVLRFEKLAEHFAEVGQQLFGTREFLFHTNASRDRTDYREFYNPELSAKIADMYRADIEAFEYSFDDG